MATAYEMSLDGRPVVPTSGRLQPLGIGDVRIAGGFWAVRQSVNSSATIGHCHDWMLRVGWVGNFRAAVADRLPADREGVVFTDSDVYKLMEATAWETGRSGSNDPDRRFRELTEVIVPAQKADGYLNTSFGRPGQPPRYSDLEWGHELYCYGHMLQAAVARVRTGIDDEFVDAARRAADHVCEAFGPGGIERVGGHPEIELGLVELARVTGEERYLRQASVFLERRGHGTLADIHWGQAYFQDNVPIREHVAFTGHSVRALYLAAAAVDVAVETGDQALLEAIIRQWEHTVARRTYITGGMGSHHDGEMYGEDFQLPPDRAYSETCAGIASVMLSWRLLLATGDHRFADLIERTLFNVVATSPAPDGRAFFYANPLHQRVPGIVPDPNAVSNRAASSLREPWFRVSCCPTNVARTYATLGAYVATTDPNGVQIHQYMPSRIDASLDGGRHVGVEVATDYPASGVVGVRIAETDGSPWTLSLRVPQWADGAVITERGERRGVAPGVATVHRAFAAGDEIVLELPIAPRWTYPDPRIDAVRGCVAVELGPRVFCLESVDLPDDTDFESVGIDPGGGLEATADGVHAAGIVTQPADRAWPYDVSSRPDDQAAEVTLALKPYHSWGTRGPASMRVWIPMFGEPLSRGLRHDAEDT